MSITPSKLHLPGTDVLSVPKTKTKTIRFKEESQQDGQHSPSDIFKGKIETCMKRQVYNSCVLPYFAETWATHAKNKLAAAQTKMEKIMLNITYLARKTNI